MPFDHIQVNVTDLQSVSSQFNARASDLEHLLQQVQSQIESLSSTWQGQSAANFNTLMAQWSTDVQGINQVLSEVSQHLTQAASGFQDTDTGISKGFQTH